MKRSLIIDPRSEDLTNAPLEIWTEPGHGPGIYVTDHKYPDPEQEILSAGGREGKRRSGPPMMGNRQIPLEVFLMGRRQDYAADPVNLIPNPSFERDLTLWTDNADVGVTGFSLTKEPNPGFAPQGEYSARMRATKDGNAEKRSARMETDELPVVVGVTYTVSLYAFFADAWTRPERPFTIELEWKTAAHAYLSESEKAFPAVVSGDEGRYALTAVAPAGAAFVVVRWYCQSTTALDTLDVWFDNARLAPEATVGDYFDGDEPGSSWDGVPGLSSSRQPANGDDHFEAMVRDLEGAWSKLRDKGGTYSRPYRDGRLIFDVEGLAAGDPGNYEGRRWVQRGQKFATTLEALPYGRGEKQTRTLRSQTTDPVMVFEESLIPGSVRALGELEITDTAMQTRRGLVAGVELPDYDPTAATAKLYYQAEALTPLGSSTLKEDAAKGVGAGKNIVANNLQSQWLELLSTKLAAGQHLTHVGTFRVFARVAARSLTINSQSWFRLAWGQGDLIARTINPVAVLDAHGAADYWILDLGIVRIAPVSVGKQRWEGRIIGRSYNPQFSNLSFEVAIDDIRIVPVGAAALETTSATPRPGTPTSFAAWDPFEQAAGVLNGKSAQIGGVWATSGEAGDFETVGYPDYRLRRQAARVGGRVALLPTVLSGPIATRITLDPWNYPSASRWQTLLLRYIDANNCIAVSRDLYPSGTWLEVYSLVGGVKNVLTPILAAPPGEVDLAFMITATGYWAAYITSSVGGPLGDPLAKGFNSAFAAGGALASGKVGFSDAANVATIDRFYDNFQAWVPSDPTLISPGRRLRWRHDGVQREDAAGGELWSPVGYEGDPLLIPPSTKAQDVMRAIVFPTRGDLDVLPDSGASDDFTAQLALTSRHVSVR